METQSVFTNRKFNMYHVVVKQAKSTALESPPLMWPKLLILSVFHLRNWVITKMKNKNICKDCSIYMTYSKSLRNKTHKLLSLLFDQRALGSPFFFLILTYSTCTHLEVKWLSFLFRYLLLPLIAVTANRPGGNVGQADPSGPSFLRC